MLQFFFGKHRLLSNSALLFKSNFSPVFVFGRDSTCRNCFVRAQFFSAYLPVHDRRHYAMMTYVPFVTGGMRLGKAGELQ